MDRGLAMTDEGAAQILGFIVGLAVVTGSLAIATYFITTTPETSSNQESQELQGDTHRAIETLTRTPGEPRDWEEEPVSELRRFGLLLPNKPHYASLEKIQQIQEGKITEDRILQSWDMSPTERGLRIEGRVQSVPIGDAPGVESYGVVQVSDGDPPYFVVPDSKNAAETYAKVNPAYELDFYDPEFSQTMDPGNGSFDGTTVGDHAFFIETVLYPKMAGLLGTYSVADHGNNFWVEESAARQAVKDYRDTTASPVSSTSWRVIYDGDPYSVAKSADKPEDGGNHTLTVSFRKHGNAPTAEGMDLWHVEDGARAFAFLPMVDVDDASSATLSFDHLLNVSDDQSDPLDSYSNDCTSLDETGCTLVRPSILFWNTTAEAWTRLDDETSACNPKPVWGDLYDANATGDQWEDDRKVDLCEALEHTGNDLYLSFFWDSSCRTADALGGGATNTTCNEDGGNRTWFIDDVGVSVDGTQELHMDFEPPKRRAEKALFVSSGVDHNRTWEDAPNHLDNNTMLYTRHLVENGSSVVSLYPNEDHDASYKGDWLSHIGLAAMSQGSQVDLKKPGSPVMRFPNDLPNDAADYQFDQTSWKQTPSSPWELPGNFSELDVVLGDGSDGFVLSGEPYEGGGTVTALARNHTKFDNATLREELYENLHATSVFQDPSFTIGPEDRDAHLPDPGSAEVVTDRRVMLVTVTPNDKYVMPLEVTLWLWEH